MKVFCRAVSDMSMASGCARLGMSIRILALFRRPSAQALLGPATGTQRQLVLEKKDNSLLLGGKLAGQRCQMRQHAWPGQPQASGAAPGAATLGSLQFGRSQSLDASMGRQMRIGKQICSPAAQGRHATPALPETGRNQANKMHCPSGHQRSPPSSASPSSVWHTGQQHRDAILPLRLLRLAGVRQKGCTALTELGSRGISVVYNTRWPPPSSVRPSFSLWRSCLRA